MPVKWRPSDSHSRLVPSASSGGISSDSTSSRKASRCRRDVEEAHVRQQLAQRPGCRRYSGSSDQAADLRRAVVVVADAQHPVDEVAVERLGVALVLHHVEEDVRRARRAVLRVDHRRPHHGAAVALFRDEHQTAVLGGRLARPRRHRRERPPRPVDDLLQRLAIVGQVHRIEVNGRLLEVVQIRGRDVADEEAAHRLCAPRAGAPVRGGAAPLSRPRRRPRRPRQLDAARGQRPARDDDAVVDERHGRTPLVDIAAFSWASQSRMRGSA